MNDLNMLLSCFRTKMSGGGERGQAEEERGRAGNRWNAPLLQDLSLLQAPLFSTACESVIAVAWPY